MLFGIISRTDPGMRHIVGFGDRFTKGVLLGANLGHAIVTSGDFHSNAALFPNYFGQTCYY